MKIKQILEEVNGIYYSNGKINGIGWSDSLGLEAQEKRLKMIIKNRIIQEIQYYSCPMCARAAETIAEDIIKDL